MPTGKFKPNTGFKMSSPLLNKKSKKQQYAEYVKKNPEAIDRPDFKKAMDAAFGGPTTFKGDKSTTKKTIARNYKTGYYGA